MTEDKIVKIVDGDNTNIQATVLTQGANGAVVVTISDGSGGTITAFGDTANYSFRSDSTTTTNITYYGFCAMGSYASTSAAIWRVFRLSDVDGEGKTWADGNANFDNIWSNRAALSYS